MQMATQHEPHADPGPDVQVHEVRDVLADAPPALADGGQVHIVLEADVRAELELQRLDEPLAPPARQVVGERDLPARGLEHAGAPHDREGHLAPADPGFRCEPVRDVADLPDQGVGAARSRRLVAAGEDVTGDIGDRGAQVAPADVDAHDPPRARVQLVQDGRRALAAGGAPGLADQARPGERLERLRDRGLRQAAIAGELGSGDRPELADELEERALVDRPQEARRAGRGDLLGARLGPRSSVDVA